MEGTSYTEFTFEETYPDGSKHYCGVQWQDIKSCRYMMDIEKKWLKEQLNRTDTSEDTLKLRQCQLDSIKIVSRTVTISDWMSKD